MTRKRAAARSGLPPARDEINDVRIAAHGFSPPRYVTRATARTPETGTFEQFRVRYREETRQRKKRRATITAGREKTDP
jgi:hypothetical protein